MLTFLQIRDYAIVDSLDLDVSEGFTCITGETGAGKSILVGALGLLCGARADTAAIREGADRAELSAGFDLRNNAAGFNASASASRWGKNYRSRTAPPPPSRITSRSSKRTRATLTAGQSPI